MRLFLKCFLGIIIFGVIASIGAYLFFSTDLPDISSLEDYHPQVVSEVFAKDGTKVGEFWTECRFFLPSERIPQRVKDAFLASEDDRFYEHKGIDLRAIFRAFVTNLKAGTIREGASTITQQVTRSLLLSRERSYRRKIREAILALKLERKLTKDHILTLYLNQIFLGNRAYGVQAAARNYFHKSIEELSLAEIALIAGLPTAPTNLSPLVNPQGARQRQLHVLKRMYESGYITAEERKSATQAKLTMYAAGTDKSFTDPDAASYVEHVRRIVKDHYGDETLYSKGLKIYTSLDLSLQQAAMKAVRKGVMNVEKRQGYRGPKGHVSEEEIPTVVQRLERTLRQEQFGKVMAWPPELTREEEKPTFKVDQLYDAVVTGFRDGDVEIQIGLQHGAIPHNGYKWARPFDTGKTGYDEGNYVRNPRTLLKVGDIITVQPNKHGSFDLAQEPELQGALFALAPNGGAVRAMVGGIDFSKSEFNRATQSLRQPGSGFKPIIYAAALDKGYTPQTVIDDAPVEYQTGDDKFWSPKNYGEEFRGSTTFADAIIFSRNIPTVKIAYDIGPHYMAAYARKLGITSPIEKYLSMALGANGVTLSELVTAYAIFAAYGKEQRPIFITRVENALGKTLEEHKVTTDNEAPLENSASVSAEKNGEEKLRAFEESYQPVEENDLNTLLFAREQRTIEQDDLRLSDPELKILYGASIPAGHVISPQTAYLMVDLLQGVVNRGTAQRAQVLNRPVAGKTGTTNDETDAWFIGFVPELVAGVWVGFDELKQIGRGETGGKTAAPIFIDFMKEATKKLYVMEFEKPVNFPTGNIGHLSGGSALFGSMPHFKLPGMRGGTDRAGAFFEEDLEAAPLPSP